MSVGLRSVKWALAELALQLLSPLKKFDVFCSFTIGDNSEVAPTMLRLNFEGITATYSFTSAPSQRYVISAEGVHDESGEVIAACHHGNWIVGGIGYTHWSCPQLVELTLEFADASLSSPQRTSGVTVYGCAVRFEDQYLATLNDGRWYSHDTHRPLTRIVLASVAAKPALHRNYERLT